MNADGLRKKREQFRVSIRKQQQEDIFSKRRLIKNSENQRDIEESLLNLAQSLQIIQGDHRNMDDLFFNLKQLLSQKYQIHKELQAFMISFFQHLIHLVPNDSGFFVGDNFIGILELSQQFLISQFSTEDTQTISEVQNQLFTQLAMFLVSFASKNDIKTLDQNFKLVIDNQIELFQYFNEIFHIEYICKFITNIIVDKSDFYTQIIEKSTFQEILLSKFEFLISGRYYQTLYQIYLYFSELTDNTDKHGTFLFQECQKLTLIFDEQTVLSDLFIQECIYCYFIFITNITNEIYRNSPRTYQLFNLMTDYQLIYKVVNYLATGQNLKYNTIEQGYKYLLNLSMIDSSFSMEQLINQQVIQLIQLQINQEQYPQYMIYPLLANLMTTNKRSTKQIIFDSGVLGRIESEFEKKLQERNHKDILYVIQCIINSFSGISFEQSQQLIPKILHCLFDYIIEFDLCLLDLETCNEIYQCLIDLHQLNKEINFSNQFVQKSQQIFDILDDDSNLVDSINYLLNIIELQYQQK